MTLLARVRKDLLRRSVAELADHRQKVLERDPQLLHGGRTGSTQAKALDSNNAASKSDILVPQVGHGFPCR